MTEKRFELIYGASAIKDTLTGTEYDDFNPVGVVTDIYKIYELLNDFAEKNEELKQKVDFYKYFQKDARELEKENEQLKKEIEKLHEQIFCHSIEFKSLYNDYRTLEKKNEQLNKKLQIYKSNGIEALNDLQRCYENSKKAMNTIDVLDEENEQLKQDGLYWAKTAEARKKEIDKLRKDNTILKQQRDYLFNVIDEVLPHSGSITVYNRMKKIGDVE